MSKRRHPQIRYRLPTHIGSPMPGDIVMGEGPRIRGGYRVLNARRSHSSLVALGCITWCLDVERLSIATAHAEIEAGHQWWTIAWDSRKRGPHCAPN